MGMVMDFITLMVAVAALFVALLTHAKVSEKGEQRTESPRPCGAPPFRQGGQERAGAAKSASPMSVEERRERAILQKQHDNFMNYDGDEQAPIDPDTILADSGE